MSDSETPVGQNITPWQKEMPKRAIEAVSDVENAAVEATHSATDTMTRNAEGQREAMNEAAARFEDASHKLGQGNAEKMHAMMTFAGMVQTGAHDLQSCLSGVVEGVIRTNLRLAQEIFLVESPRAFVELHQRFVREYFDTFQQGVSALMRATEQPSPELGRLLEH
jgi:hypothetical protein